MAVAMVSKGLGIRVTVISAMTRIMKKMQIERMANTQDQPSQSSVRTVETAVVI
jgi:pyruvate/2-oxoglutarate dehydrogenase complex dihydrolipoamide dehydrogenase (E3) component